MAKSTLVIDTLRYDKDKIHEYEEVVKELFKHLVIKEQFQKEELIKKLVGSLPIVLTGSIENIKYRAITVVVNQLLNKSPEDKGALYYQVKSIYFRKYNKENYGKQYSFYFK